MGRLIFAGVAILFACVLSAFGYVTNDFSWFVFGLASVLFLLLLCRHPRMLFAKRVVDLDASIHRFVLVDYALLIVSLCLGVASVFV